MRRGIEQFHAHLLGCLPQWLPRAELRLPPDLGKVRQFRLDPVRNIGYAPTQLRALRYLMESEVGKNSLKRWAQVCHRVASDGRGAFRRIAELRIPGDRAILFHFGGRALGVAFVRERVLLKVCDDDEIRLKDFEREVAVPTSGMSEMAVRPLEAGVALGGRVHWMLFPLLPERSRVASTRLAWRNLLHTSGFTPALVEFYRSNQLLPYNVEEQLDREWRRLLAQSPTRQSVEIIRRLHSEIRQVTAEVGARTALSAMTHGDLRPGHVWSLADGYRVIDWGKAARRNIFYDVYKQEVYRSPDPGGSLVGCKSGEHAVQRLSEGWCLPFAKQLEMAGAGKYSRGRVWQNLLLCASTNACENIEGRNELGDRTLRFLGFVLGEH